MSQPFTHYRCYRVWSGMKQRLRRDIGYAHVQLHPPWKEFANFLMDMGEAPEGYSLDRIDPSGNYEPGNCRWIPRNEQPRTTRIYLSIGPCVDCGQGRGNRSGRCKQCYAYFQRNKIPRPANAEDRSKIRKESSGQRSTWFVDQFTLDDVFIKRWPNATEAAKEVGVLHSSISNCVRNRSKSSAGFKWKRA